MFTSRHLAASRGEAAELAVLVHRVAEPVDPGVVAHGLVLHIHKDNLEVFVRGILSEQTREN